MELATLLSDVHGFLSLPEAELLYRLASQVPSGGNIVEIGSYQGRSTIALALGAKEAGAIVWAIDSHPTYAVDGADFSMVDNQFYYENIAKYQVGWVVKTINLPAQDAAKAWFTRLDDTHITWHNVNLLWIDGSHQYEDVKRDFQAFTGLMSDIKVALHDTAGHHPGVTQLVDEILAAGEWQRTEVVDAISVFERVK